MKPDMSFHRTLLPLYSFLVIAATVGLACQTIDAFIPPRNATPTIPAIAVTAQPYPGTVLTPQPTLAPNTTEAAILSQLGQIGGSSYAVDVIGKTAYLGVGPRVYALDISNPAQPQLLGQSAVLPGVVRCLVAKGQYIYAAAGKGYLQILNISDPAHPSLAASLSENSYAQGLALDQSNLYIADNAFGLRIVDVSTPLKPQKIGEVEIQGAASSIDIVGNRAYLAGSTLENALTVIDISNPARPVKTGSIAIPEAQGSLIHAARVKGDFAYVAAGTLGLIVVDISDPEHPVKTDTYKAPWADGIAIEGNSLYLSDSITGLYILDISYPSKLGLKNFLSQRLFQQVVPGQRNMVVQDGKLFLANGNQGLLIIQPNPNPILLGRFDGPLPGGVLEVVVVKNTAYAIADTLGFYSFDISDPAQPRQLDSDTSRIKGGFRTPRGLTVQGNYAYIADINNGLSIYDISNPAQLSEISRTENPQGMTDVIVFGKYAYVSTQNHDAHKSRGLLVFDISLPAIPKLVASIDTPFNILTLTRQGHYLYLPESLEMSETGQSPTLDILDISRPEAPVFIGRANTSSTAPNAASIAVSGNYVYIGDQQNGVVTYDISNPKSPVLVGSTPGSLLVFDLAIAESKIFSASYSFVGVIDISNPFKANLVEHYQTPGLSMGIAMDGKKLYIADFDGGLLVLQVQN